MPKEYTGVAAPDLFSVPNMNSALSQFAAASIPATGISALNQLA